MPLSPGPTLFPGIYDKLPNVYAVLVNSYFLYHSDKFPLVEYRKHILQFFYFAIIQQVRDLGVRPLLLKRFSLFIRPFT